MHYLRLALIAEGTSDHRFLPVILRKLTLDVCASSAPRPVEIDDEILDLTAQRIAAEEGSSRTERGREAILRSGPIFNVLFIHADGGGDPLEVRSTQVSPLADWLRNQSDFSEIRSVAVVPVREMEAWALADGDALRSAFGTVLGEDEVGLPGRPREVESIADPKIVLEAAFSQVVGRRRRKKEKASNFLNAIAERIRLESLRQVPAFQALESDLRQALDSLGYFR